MANPILAITDGTVRVDLLARGKYGIKLDSWEPQIATAKDDGVWNDNPTTTGRRLAFRKFGNVIEEFSVKVAGSSQESAIMYLQSLRRLLEKATDYWVTEWQSEPVWLEVRGYGETNSRYAIIYDYKTPIDPKLFEQPFQQNTIHGRVAGEITIEIERGHWLSDPPGSGTCIDIDSIKAINIGNGVVTSTNVSQKTLALTDDVYYKPTTLPPSVVTNGEVMAGISGSEIYNPGLHFLAYILGVDRITNARIRFTFSTENFSASRPCVLKIYGQINDPWPDTFTGTAADYTGRTRTTASVTWTLPDANVVGTTIETPDLTPIIEEVITKWGDITQIVFLFENQTPGPAEGWRAFGSADTEPGTAAPELLYTSGREGSYIQDIGSGPGCPSEIPAIIGSGGWANLTHVFVYDASVPSYSSNYVNVMGHKLFPNSMAVNDRIYFGSSTTINGNQKFCALAFHLSIPFNAAATIQWQINIAGVPTTILPINTFRVTGYQVVLFTPPTTWAIEIINGIRGYWISAKISALGGATIVPEVDRPVHSITTPYINIGEGKVSGDVTALAKIEMPSLSGSITGLLAGLRSYGRGSEFTAYLNLAGSGNAGNPTGITANALNPTEPILVSTISNYASPTGHCIEVQDNGTIPVTAYIAQISFDATILRHFYGTYRMFLRVRQETGSSEANSIRISLSNSGFATLGFTWTSQPVSPKIVFNNSSNFALEILDIGTIKIPATNINKQSDIFSTQNMLFSITLNQATIIRLYDIILMPADEWIGKYYETNISSSLYIAPSPIDTTKRIVIDGITYPKTDRAVVETIYDNAIFQPMVKEANDAPFLQAGAQQRLWVMFYYKGIISAISPYALQYSLPTQAMSCKITANSQYLGMRGRD